MPPRIAVAAVAFAALAAAPCAALAASAEAALPPTPETRVRYSISLAGLPVAHADLTLGTLAGRYVTRLTWTTSGLADVVAGSHGDVAATGHFGSRRPVPATYTLAAGEGRKAMKVMLAMAGGAVKAAEAAPPMRTAPDTVPLEPQHRVDVLDPLSATLAPAGSAGTDPDGVCRRTLPIFDGWTRYDVRLLPKTTRDAARAGIDGPTVVCAARWVPVAGHRAQSRVTRFMADNEDLSIAFGRLQKAGVWVPLELSIRTRIGTVVVETDRITTPETDRPAAR